MGSSLHIKEIFTKKEIQRFIRFPDKLYSGNRYYVPGIKRVELQTLSIENNPAFEFCRARYWLAIREGTIVGRIAGIINEKYNEEYRIKYARFGWLDFVNDFEVLLSLLNAVENWAKREHMDYIHGPLGFTSFDSSGILIEGFYEMPTSFAHYNFPYYSDLLEQAGYEKEVDWVEYNVIVPATIPERFESGSELVKKRYGLKSAELHNKKDLLKYSDELFRLLNLEYKNIYSFSELTDKQGQLYKKQFISILRPEFISIVLDSEDRVVAFGITIPSLTKAQQKIKGKLFPFGFVKILYALRVNDTVDTLLIAVKKDYQNKGVNGIIFKDIINSLIRNGISNIESNRELENNIKINNLWNKFEHRQHKRTRCYKKKLK